MGRPSRFSSAARERAIRLVMEESPAHPTEWAALLAVATKLGMTVGAMIGRRGRSRALGRFNTNRIRCGPDYDARLSLRRQLEHLHLGQGRSVSARGKTSERSGANSVRLSASAGVGRSGARQRVRRRFGSARATRRVGSLELATGIKPELYERGEFSGGEQGLDQCLQVHMLRAISDNHEPQIAVLMTGDGAGYDDGVGFHADMERMHAAGWGVEVLSWQNHCRRALREWATSYGVLCRWTSTTTL